MTGGAEADPVLEEVEAAHGNGQAPVANARVTNGQLPARMTDGQACISGAALCVGNGIIMGH
ncbi:hypothetical protein BG418_16310 [Streptomyces sp. CBMA152]|nr:hypothetical protein [Streptomyces sp. CBMA152]